MAEQIRLNPEALKSLRNMNPMLMSYNVEFAEVTGGTFWKAYTPEQVEAMFSVLESKVAEVKEKFTATKAKENTAFSFRSRAE